MIQLRGFAEQATPVAVNLRKAAPGLTDATKLLRPFSRAATISVANLGDNAAASQDDLAASSPVIRQLRKAGVKSIPGARNLNQLLMTLRRTGGIDYLTKFILNASNSFNGFDDLGHFLLTQIQITNCVDYVTSPAVGCDGRWVDPGTNSALDLERDQQEGRRQRGRRKGARALRCRCQRHQGPPQLPDRERQLMRRRQSPLNAAFRNPTVIGALAVLITILAVFLAYNANNGLPFVQSYRLTAQVPNAAALVKGNEVRIGGVRVGIVESIEPVAEDDGTFAAQLELKLDKRSSRCRSTRRVIIRSRSALGLKYLEITRGTSDKGFAAGSMLPLSAAHPEPVEFDQFL